MTCDDLISFADGEMSDDPARAEAFRGHLRDCEACASGLIEAIQLHARLSELPPRPPTPVPVHEVKISGWHEHRDGTWGYYSWRGAGGVIYLAMDIAVPNRAATLDPPDVVLAEMAARLRANGLTQEAAWCELAMQGHVLARVEALKIRQRGIG